MIIVTSKDGLGSASISGARNVVVQQASMHACVEEARVGAPLRPQICRAQLLALCTLSLRAAS